MPDGGPHALRRNDGDDHKRPKLRDRTLAYIDDAI